MAQPTVHIKVPELDTQAVPTGTVIPVELSAAQVEDIVAHAKQVVVAHNSGFSTASLIEELSEALGAGGIF